MLVLICVRLCKVMGALENGVRGSRAPWIDIIKRGKNLHGLRQ
jgi:hypothetical protein